MNAEQIGNAKSQCLEWLDTFGIREFVGASGNDDEILQELENSIWTEFDDLNGSLYLEPMLITEANHKGHLPLTGWYIGNAFSKDELPQGFGIRTEAILDCPKCDGMGETASGRECKKCEGEGGEIISFIPEGRVTFR